jgi:hypothetical protein
LRIRKTFRPIVEFPGEGLGMVQSDGGPYSIKKKKLVGAILIGVRPTMLEGKPDHAVSNIIGDLIRCNIICRCYIYSLG